MDANTALISYLRNLQYKSEGSPQILMPKIYNKQNKEWAQGYLEGKQDLLKDIIKQISIYAPPTE